MAKMEKTDDYTGRRAKQMLDLGANGEPVKLGLMGGTFDPIHIGHLFCAEQAMEAFGLDAVLFVPTGNPAYKNREVTPASKRLRMVELAIASNPRFGLSAVDVMRGGNTYAIDTLHDLHAQYPDNIEFFFITGADSILTIQGWKDCDEMADLARFVAVARPGFDLQEERIAQIAEETNLTIDVLQIQGLDVSASQIRALAAEGKSIRYLVPEAVRAYIERWSLYRKADGSQSENASSDEETALSDEFFAARKAELADRVNAHRYQHIEGVIAMAERLAEIYGVDVRKARLAALLHDWDKGYNDPEIKARAYELGLDEPEVVIETMPQTLHGMTAALALAREFPEIPADVLQAIYRHTTAALGMTDLDMVVYIADCLEDNRQFGKLAELRAEIGTVPLEELFVDVHAHWISLIVGKHGTLHPDTITIWNEYALRRRDEKKDGMPDGAREDL